MKIINAIARFIKKHVFRREVHGDYTDKFTIMPGGLPRKEGVR